MSSGRASLRRPAGEPLQGAAEPAQRVAAGDLLRHRLAELVDEDGGGADVEEGERLVAVVLQVAHPAPEHVALGGADHKRPVCIS